MIGELAALGTAGCWAFTSLFFAEAARRVGALRVNLLRLPAALVMLSTALLVIGSGLATLHRERVAYLAASAIVGLVAGDLALFAALRRIGPRLASLLMSLAPLFATWTGMLFLAERPGRVALAGMALTLGGVAWVVSERRGRDTAAFERGRVPGDRSGARQTRHGR
jgi:drug/metabolite transporter (DMT)-like permease